MSCDAATARNETFSLIRAGVQAWDPTVRILWQGVPDKTRPSQTETWCRAAMNHVTATQASLAGVDGLRRWNREGLVLVQCFAPLFRGSVQRATELADAARNSLQGKQTASGVWYRNARIIEVGEDQEWFLVNCSVQFTYDELRSGAGEAPPPTVPEAPTPQQQYTFSTPQLEWTINHNAGRRVSVSVYTLGGQQIWASVQNISSNTVVVVFDTPQDGYAILDYH